MPTGYLRYVSCPEVLLLGPRIRPLTMRVLASPRRDESDVADDDPPTDSEGPFDQPLKQRHLRRKLELVQHIRRDDPVATPLQLGRHLPNKSPWTSTPFGSLLRALASISAEKSVPQTALPVFANLAASLPVPMPRSSTVMPR